MDIDPDDIRFVQGLIEASAIRDLAQEDLGPRSVPNWEGFPTRLYAYAKTDADGTTKPGRVIMLNPTPERAATWIVSATLDAKGVFVKSFATLLHEAILQACGYQFIVRGIRWRDKKKSGTHLAHAYFDGAPAKLRGKVEHGPAHVFSEVEMERALAAEIGDIAEIGLEGGLIATRRDEYLDAGGRMSAEGMDWADAIRENYQDAWNGERNFLIYAKAVAL